MLLIVGPRSFSQSVPHDMASGIHQSLPATHDGLMEAGGGLLRAARHHGNDDQLRPVVLVEDGGGDGVLAVAAQVETESNV